MYACSLLQDRYTVEAHGRVVPCALWRPVHSGNPSSATTVRGIPLVLAQHGGSGHKEDAPTSSLAKLIVEKVNAAVLAIDGPWHGERCPYPDLTPEQLRDEFLARWRTAPCINEYVDDWLVALAVTLQKYPELDGQRLGWYGVSMGTAYGLSVLAKLSHVRAAVLGKWSAAYPNSQHLVEAARAVSCPVLFIHHEGDELFDFKGCYDIFQALRSADRTWMPYPSAHSGRGEAELKDTLAHLGRLN